MTNEGLKKVHNTYYTLQATEKENVYMLFRNDGKVVKENIFSDSDLLCYIRDLYDLIKKDEDPDVSSRFLDFEIEDTEDRKAYKIIVSNGIKIEMNHGN